MKRNKNSAGYGFSLPGVILDKDETAAFAQWFSHTAWIVQAMAAQQQGDEEALRKIARDAVREFRSLRQAAAGSGSGE